MNEFCLGPPESETGRSLNSRQLRSTQGIPGQAGLHSNTLSQKNKQGGLYSQRPEIYGRRNVSPQTSNYNPIITICEYQEKFVKILL